MPPLPGVIDSGESSLSCDPELTSSSTSLSSSIIHETEDDNIYWKKVKLEIEQLDLEHKTGMKSPDQRSETPTSEGKIAREGEPVRSLNNWKD